MRVLLINPFITAHYESGVESFAEPLGLLYLAAVAEHNGHEVKVLDMFGYGHKIIEHLSDGRVHIGLGLDVLSQMIDGFQPHIVGISSMFSFYQSDCFKISERIKRIDPKMWVVWGGTNASANAGDLIRNQSIDCIIAGEGEQAFIHLLKNLGAKRIDYPGIYYKYDGEISINTQRHRNEDLDSLPFPARHLLNWKGKGFKELYTQGRIWVRRRRVAAISTSRGCPFGCVYCCSRNTWGRVWKARSAGNILSEIKVLYDNYNIKEFHIYDDNASLQKKRLLQLCDLIQSEGLKISFAAPNGLFIGSLDREILTAFTKIGLYRITLPIESACPKTIKYINGKPIDLTQVKSIVSICNELGIWTHANFIIGFPEETRQDIEETVGYSCSLDIDSCSVFIAQPLPNTRLYETFHQLYLFNGGKLIPESSCYVTKYNTKYFTKGELNELRKKAIKLFAKTRAYRIFFKPNYTRSLFKKVSRNGMFIANIIVNKFLKHIR